MPTANDLYNKIKDEWPEDEPLDYAENSFSELYSKTFIDYDANAYEDWMNRIANHYPELYFSMNQPVSDNTEEEI